VQGADLQGVFQDIITHSARETVSRHETSPHVTQGAPSAGAAPHQAAGQPSWAVTVQPLQGPDAAHTCPLCPPSMCKGMHVNALASHHPRIVFCGDGANDVCPVLRLRAGDVALVREGFSCWRLLRERAARGLKVQQPACQVRFWCSQADLAALVRAELAT
jgi:Putative Phosphatase